MPGFAPLAAATLGSVRGVSSRQAAAVGHLALQGQAHVDLRASASAEGIAPGFAGEVATGGTVDVARSLGAAGIAGQAQGDTASHGLAAGAVLSLKAVVGVRAATTVAAVGTLGVILLARSSPASTIRADGTVPLAGAQDAASRISGSAAPLWQVLSNADAAAAIDGRVNVGRLLPLEGTGQGRAATQAQGFGTVGLGGDARLAVAALAHAESGATVAGTTIGLASLGLTLASDFGLTGAASGISLRVREGSARAEFSLRGQSTGSLTLSGRLGAPFTPEGIARAQAGGRALGQGVIGITRGIATEVDVGAAAARVLPLKGNAAAHAALRAEAQSVVVTAGLGRALLATRLVLSGELASSLMAAAEISAEARADGAIGAMAQVRVSAPVGLAADGGLNYGLNARGLNLAAVPTAGARVSLGGKAQASLRGAAVADGSLAVQATGAGGVRLLLRAEPQLVLTAIADGRAGLRADLLGPVAFSGLGDVALRVSAGTQAAALPLVGRLGATLAVNAAAQGQINFVRNSLGEVGIDAVSVPALELDLTLKAKTATHGISADNPAIRGASSAAAALAGGFQDQFALETAAGTLAVITGFGRSGVALAGVGHAQVASKVLAFGAVTVERQSDGDVAVVGTTQPALPIAGAAVLRCTVTGSSSNGVAPLSLEVRISASISVAAGSGLAVTGAATGRLALAGQSADRFQVGRDGGADVAVTGETARIIAFPGRGVAAVANAAGTESGFLTGLSGAGATRILMRLTSKAVQAEGAARSSVLIGAAVKDEPWGTMLQARGFRAPPALQRRVPPDTWQGGSVMSHTRGGVLLSEPRTGRILRG